MQKTESKSWKDAYVRRLTLPLRLVSQFFAARPRHGTGDAQGLVSDALGRFVLGVRGGGGGAMSFVSACMHACIHACMHTCIHAYTWGYMRLHTRIGTDTDRHRHTQTHAHRYTHIYTHTYIHTHTHTHTHTHSMEPRTHAGALVFDNVTFRYPTRQSETALQSVTFSVRGGEVHILNTHPSDTHYA